jgi:hypothetical protein
MNIADNLLHTGVTIKNNIPKNEKAQQTKIALPKHRQ